MGFFWAVVAGIIASALFSGLAAFYGVWLGRNRYYEERLWDRKTKAYSQIVEALVKAKASATKNYGSENDKEWSNFILEPDESTQRSVVVMEIPDEIHELLESAIYMNDFVIPSDISDVLHKFYFRWIAGIQLEFSPESRELASKRLGAVTSCLEDVKILIKKDLERHNSKPFWIPLYFRGSGDLP